MHLARLLSGLLLALSVAVIPTSVFADDYFRVDYSTQVSTNMMRSGLNVQKVAVEHTATSTYDFSGLGLELNAVNGDPVLASLTVKVYSGGSTPEAGSLIGTSDPYASSLLASTTAQWTYFTFSTPVHVVSGTKYFYVLESSNLDNPKMNIAASANTWQWRYCPGCGGATWQDAGATFSFALVNGFSTTATRINSVIPLRDSVIATSSAATWTIGGYVNIADWTTRTEVYVRYRQLTGAGVRGNGNIYEGDDFTLPITASGSFSVSTTSHVIHSGVYQAYAAIQKPKYSIFGIAIPFFTDTLASVTWQFTGGTSTASELADGALLLGSTGFTTSASSTVVDLSCHVGTDFSITDCINNLIFPDTNELQKIFDDFHDTFLVKAPIGYVTRFVTIMSGNVTAVKPPPIINYSFGSSSPQILRTLTASDPIYFQPFDHLTELNSVRSDNGTNKTVWDVIDPVMKLLVSMAVLSVILGDLIELRIASSGGDDGEYENGRRVVKDDQYYMKMESKRSKGMQRNDIQM